MKLGARRFVSQFKKARARDEDGADDENGREPRADGGSNGDKSSSTTMSKIASFRFKVAPRKSEDGQPTPVRSSGNGKTDFNSPLFKELPEALKEQSRAQDHLWEYLRGLPIDDIGVPDYQPRLSRGMRDIKYRNLIYPVGKGVFVHLRPDVTDSRDFYIPVEPSMNAALPKLMVEVDKHLINYVDELKKATDAEGRTLVLLQCLDQICTTKTGRRQGSTVQVTGKELQGLKYLMVRDKQGLGYLEPLISDPYIEDISCSGVGSLFVEHKIFGGLKAGVTFETTEELDKFVISLSEKISRPVTVRDPIVDAVLPDGSRVNIVYGGDVSKRGSNFTIRKFSAIPMSILDLIDGGTLTYQMAAYISLMLGEGMNTFVSGETASGKTTLLNAITTFINPNAKIVSIEDTPELQVPHPNWTREVVRGSASGGASVTMFDLLRAALRQRPNEIIIGEIRGEEGAVAFQAMQTGHAASVEKLIQRLTGNPINIPKTYIDNLNMVIIMSAVRLPDGRPARRVLSINKIVEYDPESNSFGFIEVFRWDAATDTFEFPAYMNTSLLEHVVSLKRGTPPHESRKIYEVIDERTDILKKLHERDLTNFYELHNVLSQAYREGLFR